MGPWLNNPAVNPQGIGLNNNNNMVWSQMQNINSLPHYEVIQVSGENGVDAFQMGPNSSVILADTTAPLIWLVRTDGAGYKTKIPYDIMPHQSAERIDFSSLEQRITQLEEIVNAKQPPTKQSRKQSSTNKSVQSDAGAEN